MLIGAGLQPALSPLAVPRVTLEDGRRKVVFQGMVHVGSERFYRSDSADLFRARDACSVMIFAAGLQGRQRILAAAMCGCRFRVILGRTERPDALNGDILDFRNRHLAEPQAWLSATATATATAQGHRQSQVDALLSGSYAVTV